MNSWVHIDEEAPGNLQVCVVWVEQERAGRGSAHKARWSHSRRFFLDMNERAIEGRPTHWRPWPVIEPIVSPFKKL